MTVNLIDFLGQILADSEISADEYEALEGHLFAGDEVVDHDELTILEHAFYGSGSRYTFADTADEKRLGILISEAPFWSADLYEKFLSDRGTTPRQSIAKLENLAENGTRPETPEIKGIRAGAGFCFGLVGENGELIETPYAAADTSYSTRQGMTRQELVEYRVFHKRFMGFDSDYRIRKLTQYSQMCSGYYPVQRDLLMGSVVAKAYGQDAGESMSVLLYSLLNTMGMYVFGRAYYDTGLLDLIKIVVSRDEEEMKPGEHKLISLMSSGLAQKYPDDLEMLALQAYVSYAIGDYQQSIASYQELLALSDDGGAEERQMDEIGMGYYGVIGMNYLELYDKGQARVYFIKAIEADSNDFTLGYLCRMLEQDGEYKGLVEVMHLPTDPTVFYFATMSLMNFELAIEIFKSLELWEGIQEKARVLLDIPSYQGGLNRSQKEEMREIYQLAVTES